MTAAAGERRGERGRAGHRSPRPGCRGGTCGQAGERRKRKGGSRGFVWGKRREDVGPGGKRGRAGAAERSGPGSAPPLSHQELRYRALERRHSRLQVLLQPLPRVTGSCFSAGTFTNAGRGSQGTERSKYRYRGGQADVCQAGYFGVFGSSVLGSDAVRAVGCFGHARDCLCTFCKAVAWSTGQASPS